MYIWKRETFRSYPHIDNNDMKMVIDINEPRVYEQYVMANGKARPQYLYLRKDIEELFWPIIKEQL